MPSKYRLVKEGPYYRVIRIFDGLEGGLIESEHNLSQDGNSWIDYTSIVMDNVIVRGNATVKNSLVKDDAIIGGNAFVDSSSVYGSSFISDDSVIDNSIIMDRASITRKVKVSNSVIKGDALVYGDFTITGGTITDKTTSPPICLKGLSTFDVTIMDSHISIGCMTRTIESWRKFSEKDIDQFEKRLHPEIIEALKILKPVLSTIVEHKDKKGFTNS